MKASSPHDAGKQLLLFMQADTSLPFIFKGETLQPVVIGVTQRNLKQVERIVYQLLNSSVFPKHTTVLSTSAYH